MRAVVAGTVFALAACAVDDPDALGTAVSSVNVADFVLPSLAPELRAPIVRGYDALDPDDVVPRGLLEDAIVYFDVNKAHIPLTRYFVVVDQSRYSGDDRFWLVDTTTGIVEPHKVAHGDGSDPD
ncbi:MAG: hypothetical protein NT062_14760, partial [Proteobacteria bacterium]|nr:hypothetical protein [Pseudomonadota bacterium]